MHSVVYLLLVIALILFIQNQSYESFRGGGGGGRGGGGGGRGYGGGYGGGYSGGYGDGDGVVEISPAPYLFF